MNRLIGDHLRRWWWVLAICGSLEFALGAFIAGRPKDPFEFFGLLVAMWAGSSLLLKDVQHGLVRNVAVLPLKIGQIGHAWWLATIAIPAIALAALLFLGAGCFCHFHPNLRFPADRLAMASLFNVAWLSTMFVCISSTPGFEGKGWQRVRSASFSLLAVLMLFSSMLYFQNAADNPFKRTLLLGVGALLTVEGWLGSGRFVLGRAAFRLSAPPYPGPCRRTSVAARRGLNPEVHRRSVSPSGIRERLFRGYLRWQEGRAVKIAPGQAPAPSAYGGIPLLIRTTFVRTFCFGAALVALMPLMMALQGHAHAQFIEVQAGLLPFMFVFLLFVLQPAPALRQLRWLRTLPVSATLLAAVLLTLFLLPFIAVGALATAVAGASWGAPAAAAALKNFTLMLAPASWCIFFSLWRGDGRHMYLWLLLTLFGFQLAPLFLRVILHLPEFSFSQTAAFAAFSVLVAFWLTRRAVQHSSQPYLVPPNQCGNLWGAIR